MREHKSLYLIVFLLLITRATLVYAGEGATSSYLVGFNDFFAGILPKPGLYFRNDSVFFSANANELLAEGFLETNANLKNYANISRLTYVTPYRIFDSNWAVSLRIPIINSNFSGGINSPIFISQVNQSVNNLGDIVVSPLILGWHHNYFHWLVSIPSIYFPTGTYSLSRFINTGKNRYAVQGDINSTYYNANTGLEATLALGLTRNFENHATNYVSGDELHLDALVATHTSSGISMGVAGFYLQQITGDSGAGATLGSNKGMTIGLGPAFDYSTIVKKLNVSVRTKYYFDINTVNRWHGDWFWFSVLLS